MPQINLSLVHKKTQQGHKAILYRDLGMTFVRISNGNLWGARNQNELLRDVSEQYDVAPITNNVLAQL